MSEEIKEEEKLSDAASGNKQWYAVSTYGGRENIVADYLEKRRVSLHLEDYIFRIVVVEQEEVVYDKVTGKPAINKKTGEVKTKMVKPFPSYVFVEMIMSDQAWYAVRNTQGVTGFVGSSGGGTKPFPIPREEIEPILKKMNLIENVVRSDYEVGDEVRIVEGVFADEVGEIVKVDLENSSADVVITFFGRPSSVTVSFSSIEKA